MKMRVNKRMAPPSTYMSKTVSLPQLSQQTVQSRLQTISKACSHPKGKSHKVQVPLAMLLSIELRPLSHGF